MSITRRTFLAGTAAAAASAALPAVATGDGVSLYAASHPIDHTHMADALRYSFAVIKEIVARNVLEYEAEREHWINELSLENVEVEIVQREYGDNLPPLTIYCIGKN